jgi:hypothetical protein
VTPVPAPPIVVSMVRPLMPTQGQALERRKPVPRAHVPIPVAVHSAHKKKREEREERGERERVAK